MASTRVLTGMVLVAAIAAAPVFADDGQHRHDGDRGRGRQEAQSAPRSEQAVPRAVAPQAYRDRRENVAVPRYNYSARNYDNRGWDNHNNDVRHYTYSRPYYATRGYPRTVIVPRYIQPRIVTVVPYHPYVYHPSFSIGVFYGAGGAYPYGYTPRGYYDPLPGHYYGGLRITGAPRDAQVFADGYLVGIVNDFDGVFQHMNLEAGTHHIEIQAPGLEPIAFDVNVQPGQTITYRADIYQP